MNKSSVQSEEWVGSRPRWSRPRIVSGSEPLTSLRAVVLLSGSVCPLPWRTAIGRSVLDLPLEPGLSLLGHWVKQVQSLAEAIGLPELALRVVLCRAAPIPTAHPAWNCPRVRLRIERDTVSYRGTGGILRDLAGTYAPQDHLLVASAAQVLLEDLEPLARELVRTDGDIALLADPHGVPGNLMLIRCGPLGQVQPVGFVDFKEQALPELAKHHRIRVLHRSQPAVAPVLTSADYLAAIRQYRQRHELLPDPAERGFRIVEPTAQIDGQALLHDSVVLLGARVGAGAVLIRSIVCENAKVAAGLVAIDRVIPCYAAAQGGNAPSAAFPPPVVHLPAGWCPQV